MYVNGMGYTWFAEEAIRAMEFYRNLCATVYGDANKHSQGIMSAELIAEHMDISVDKANEYLKLCRKHGITERQGGGWVV